MGVTIHYEGTLKNEAQLQVVIDTCKDFAAQQSWPSQEVTTSKTLMRLIDEESRDYTGPVKGIIVQPEGMCEPLEFEFDDLLFVQSYCKTQFAGKKVHMQVVELLRKLSPCFDSLVITDEGEYWNQSSEERLTELIEGCNNWMRETMSQRPDYEGPVFGSDGRILDLVRKEAGVSQAKEKSWFQKIFKL